MAKDTRALSINELEQMLEEKRNRQQELETRREQLAAEMQQVEAELEALGGATAPTRRGGRKAARRGRRPGAIKATAKKATARKATAKKAAGSKTAAKKATGRKSTRRKVVSRGRRQPEGERLVDYIEKVLAKADGPMRAKDIEQAVQSEGYTSQAKEFYTIVSQALRDSARFERVSRGMYELAEPQRAAS